MLLRTLFVLLFAAALALPYLRASSAAALSQNPTACLILLDDTMSMQCAVGGETLDARARAQAVRLLDELRSFDRAAVRTFSGRVLGRAEFTADLEDLKLALREAEPGFGRHLAAPALKDALSALEEQALAEKLLVVFSDGTRSSWADEDLLLLAGAPARVVVPDLWRAPVPDNHHVESLDLRIGRDAVQANLAVASSGRGAPDALPCTFRLGTGAAAKATARLDETGRGVASLSVAAPGGWFTGEVRLPADALQPDNVRYVCGRSAGPLQVLVVDGDPRESIHDSESFYLDLALRSTEERKDLVSRVVTHQELVDVRLADYGCVILANAPAKSLGTGAPLRAFVKDGGGLLVLPGDRADAAAYQSAIGEVMPALLTGRKSAQTGRAPESLTVDEATHPVFSLFEAPWLPRFADARFTSWWSLTPHAGAHVMASFSDGTPALVEGEFGRGRVLLVAGPLDRDWNDLCIQPVFVPFLHQCVRHLGRRLGGAETLDLRVGDALTMDVQARAESVHVLGPESGWQEIRLLESGQARRLVYKDTWQPGVYTVATRPDAGAAVARFAVNVEPGESDLRRIERGEIKRALADREQASGAARVHGGGAMQLWPLLLWMALGALVAESILARK